MPTNTHQVLKTADNSFLNSIKIDEKTDASLRLTRDKVRDALKDGFKDLPKFMEIGSLFEDAGSEADSAFRPKFKMQGSFSYHTHNQPAQTPPQQIDLDDGMFLPVSFVSQKDTLNPRISSQGYFQAVESILEPLCKKEGWQLISDKPSCVRVQISKHAHMDIALYAIPDDDYAVLQEEVLAKVAMDSAERAEMLNSRDFEPFMYEKIPADHIMLAHRVQGWKPSDPRKLEDWFKGKIDTHGSQLREICRTLKGWKDHQWPETRLSSIAIMSAVVTAYDEKPHDFETARNDKALELVAERLPDILSKRIANPVVSGQYLDEGWKPEQRTEIVQKATELRDNVRAAIKANDPQTALDKLIATFGSRVPNEQDLVILEGLPTATKSASPLTTGFFRGLGSEQAVKEAVVKDGDGRYA